MSNLDNIKNILKYNKYVPNRINLTGDVYNKIKKYLNVEIINIWYKSDNLKIHGFIVKRKNLRKEVPVVIYCRGGKNSKKYSKGELKPIHFYNNKGLIELVNEGKIIIFASNYRGSSLSEGVDEYGGKDVNDIINLYPIIKKYKFSNHHKICVYGWSRGVMMALLVHKKVSWVKCLILGAGIYDLNSYKVLKPSTYKMYRDEYSLKLKDMSERSAVRWVNKLSKRVHMLIFHGINDEISLVEYALNFKTELEKNKMIHKFILYDDGHSLMNSIDKVANEVIEWIDIYLL